MGKNCECGCESCGVIGSVLAVILSYMKWHSVGWAILHFLLGWIYVIYYLIEYGFPGGR